MYALACFCYVGFLCRTAPRSLRSNLRVHGKENLCKACLLISCFRLTEYEDLEAKAEEGLKQIEECRYEAGLGPQIRKVVKYGISFWKKESFVKVRASAR